MMHIIDKLAQEHETLSKITAHLSNGEDSQAKAELSEMIWRLAGVADSLQSHNLEYSFEHELMPHSALDFKISHSNQDFTGQVIY